MEEWIAEYYDDRYGLKLLKSEGGFLFYSIVPEKKVFFIAEFHIGRAHRASAHAFTKLMTLAREKALDEDCRFFTCKVPLGMKNSEKVLVNNLKYGFKISVASASEIQMFKDLLEDESK